jgi:hypothetical protein
MDSTSDMLSASICRDVNSALFHFNIIISVVSQYVHLHLLSGLSHCRPGHIPWNFTWVLMTVITTDGSYHRPWDIPYNWVNCAVLTGNSAGLRTVFSSRLSHTELRSSLREPHSFLSLPPDTTMASSQGTLPQHPFLAIHSADEHRMIYSFSNTTSYSTIYAFFSSFRITLWTMWLANSKRQPCFYPP